MKTGFLERQGLVRVKEFETPSIGREEVLIKVVVAGICGSDVHAYHGTHPFRRAPMILGHEVAGEVVSIGSEVKKIKVGDRVTVEPQKNCGTCSYCRNGEYNLCKTKIMAGVGGWLGTFAEYFVAPEQRVYTLPSSISYDIGVLAEPLAVGVHAARIGNVQEHEKAIVLGTGPIGILSAVAMQSMGVENVFCTDINDFRLKTANSLGIKTINVEKESIETKTYSYAPDGFDIAIVSVTSPAVINQALQLVRRGGRVIIVSVFTSDIPLNMGAIQANEIEIKGSNVYTSEDFNQSLRILTERAQDLEHIVTHHMKLSEINEAMQELNNSKNQALKIIIDL
ncbi:alcohol dehydrogenase catalytic domain-containing protein [Priestia sp. SIMBA_032]|uniref:zinc-dependent alcohol dehydrogenase n=1 Tax=Priestia sp. SIMBA_032 TaxID=3085775 RepID=UPI00397E7D74